MRYFLWACFSFRGRISIATYWGLILAGFVFILIGALALSRTGLVFIPIVIGKWVLLAALAKRWHDCGYSGAMCLLNFVPLVGLITLVAAGLISGSPGPNRYGEEPDVDNNKAEQLIEQATEGHTGNAPSQGAITPAKETADDEIAADSARLNYVGRNVSSLFQTSRGMVAQMKDSVALAQIGSDFRVFNSLEDYRKVYNDHEMWQQVTNSARKWRFFASASVPLEELNANLDEKLESADASTFSPGAPLRDLADEPNASQRTIQCSAGNIYDPAVYPICPCPSCWADRASLRLAGKASDVPAKEN